MVTILNIDQFTKEIKGWILATDIDDARRQAQIGFLNDLAAELYQMTYLPKLTKYQMKCGYLMLQ